MAYGIRMYNKYGKLNIDETSKAIRIHDEGTATIPAGSSESPYNLYIDIKPISYIPVISVIDIDPIFPVYAADTSFSGLLDPTLNGNNQFNKIILTNASLSTRTVKWRVWGHI